MPDPATTLELVPHLGVPPAHLGMTRREIQGVLGFPERPDPDQRFFYYRSSFKITFDDGGRADYMELSWNDVFDARYDGMSVFDTLADDVIDIVARKAPVTIEEGGHTAVFYELDLALWRPVLPSDHEPNDPHNEYRNGQYWMTIGVGKKGYFKAARDRRDLKAQQMLAELGLDPRSPD